MNEESGSHLVVLSNSDFFFFSLISSLNYSSFFIVLGYYFFLSVSFSSGSSIIFTVLFSVATASSPWPKVPSSSYPYNLVNSLSPFSKVRYSFSSSVYSWRSGLSIKTRNWSLLSVYQREGFSPLGLVSLTVSSQTRASFMLVNCPGSRFCLLWAIESK
jgi:hypothetical protein